jgi:hypothetical protein
MTQQNYADVRYERTTVGLGYLFNLLAWLNWPKVTRLLMRRPWHVADELQDGRWVPIYAWPKRPEPTVDELNAVAERLATELPAKQHTPVRTYLSSVKLHKGMKVWQLVDGQAKEIPTKPGRRGWEVDIDMTKPTTVAINAENALRKLKHITSR